MEKIQKICFLSIGLLLGSLAPLYGKTFNYFLLSVILFCAITNWNMFIQNVKEGKGYILIFVIYFLYISLQTLFMEWRSEITDKPY